MKTTSIQITIGIDLGDKKHAICVLDSRNEIIEERSITNDIESLRRLSKKHPGALIVFEVGTHSPWTDRAFRSWGHEVIIANPRKVRAIYQNDRKCDRRDAMMLAKLANFDRAMLYPVQHQSEQAQRDILRIKMRDSLVRRRVDLISTVRCTLKSMGVTTKCVNTNYFARHLRRDLAGKHDDLLELLKPILDSITELTHQIQTLDRDIQQLAAERYPETGRLSQITGVGVITSLTFLLVVGDPERFLTPRDIGAYLGLVPKRDQSGDLDKEMRISKAGHSYLRQLLVGSAQYILGPFGPDCDLRARGLELIARGGKRAKKKAVVATARKLSVVMLTLLREKTDYDACRNKRETKAAPA